MDPPFPAQSELCQTLCLSSDSGSIQRSPKPTSSQSTTATDVKSYLPNLPRVALHDPMIGDFLESDLVTPTLDKLAPHLWLVAKQDSSHISTLTHQIVRGRQIIVSEDPGLHLVWIEDRVFVKPVPKYLLSHAFWKYYLTSNDSPIPQPQRTHLTKAALGFLRSYSHLIRHKSDHRLAVDDKHLLVPAKIPFSDFTRFIVAFEHVPDSDVSPRYAYGELRLSRLNFWTKIFLRRFTYQKVHGQYAAYFARFYAPILFAFGVFSVMLSAMQVALAVQQLITSGPSWQDFARVSRGFSIFAIFVVVLVIIGLAGVAIALSSREIVFALRDLYRRHSARKGRKGISPE
ncbi:hypothetical protein P170DRAFT_48916 [Aspergillus steynii IBT 23096]|uniref:Subtilisin-like serine protease n=1 Tax=Aspergillus steynii IBT 23096 TaxID=1392250 RepID=A0A2I2GS75_9EURO|nr:uncharacterized protein P170DRAFT_48916 [Aspergillus steynii IBT 23096]PLB55731.1 hypothetical protein P170DRAFT_48916 [Aspergillus steynii IBT 23096]